MIRDMVKHSFPKLSVSETDVNALAQLCVMNTVLTGEEDPHLIVRTISDQAIDAIVKNLKVFAQNPVISRLSNIFTVEWAWRHGYLQEDWKWEWASKSDGRLHYRSAVPLDAIADIVNN